MKFYIWDVFHEQIDLSHAHIHPIWTDQHHGNPITLFFYWHLRISMMLSAESLRFGYSVTSSLSNFSSEYPENQPSKVKI